MALAEVESFTPFEPVGTISESANRENEPVGTRREWRIKKETGELRGVSIRERNKERKPKGWIDSRSKGWGDIIANYETWRRNARYAVGTFEQPVGEYDKQPTSADNGRSNAEKRP